MHRVLRKCFDVDCWLRALGLSLLLIPAGILAFADLFARYVAGSPMYFGRVRDPFPNGVNFLFASIAVIALVQAGAWTYSKLRYVTKPHANLCVPGKSFRTRLLLFLSAIAWVVLLSTLLFGYLAIGAKSPGIRVTDVEAVRQKAEAIFGGDIPLDEPLEAFTISGFALRTYELRTIPKQTANAPITFTCHLVRYEEWGFPFRCIYTPIGLDVPRPGLRGLFDSGQDQFILTELTNLELMPLPFAANIVAFAAFFSAAWCVPPYVFRTFRRRRRARRGCCLECGYILKDLPRCPECGTQAHQNKRTVNE